MASVGEEEEFGLREFWSSLDEKQKHALLALRRVSKVGAWPPCKPDLPAVPACVRAMRVCVVARGFGIDDRMDL